VLQTYLPQHLANLHNLASALPLPSVSLLNQLLERPLKHLLVRLLNPHSVLPLRLESLLSQLLEHLPLWVLLLALGSVQQAEWETRHHHGERLHNPLSPSPTPFRPLLVVRPGSPSLEVLGDRIRFRALEATTPRRQAQGSHPSDKDNRSLALQA
jgi:hypothetical protein